MKTMASGVMLEKAGVDITSGIGADHFVRGTGKEPWGRDCLIRLIDAICNYSVVVYPLPTKHAGIYHVTGDLPSLMLELEVKHRLIRPYRAAVAEDHVPRPERLSNDFSDFQRAAQKTPNLLAGWIALHDVIGHTHTTRLPDKVQPWIKDFFDADYRPPGLAKELGVSLDGLRFAFDVFARTQQYYEVLSSLDAAYFPHPLRLAFGEQLFTAPRSLKGNFSWGGVIAACLDEGVIEHDPTTVAAIVAQIATRVKEEHLTWYDPPDERGDHDRRLAIADALAIPAKFKSPLLSLIEWFVITVSAGLDNLTGLPISPFVARGTQVFKDRTETAISGTPLRIKLLRHNLYLPGATYWADKAKR